MKGVQVSDVGGMGPVDAQRVAAWTRRYLQTRTMGVLIFMLVFLGFVASVTGLNALIVLAVRQGNHWLLGVSIAGEVLWVAAVICFSVPRWGGRLVEKWTGRYYEKEGAATLPIPEKRVRPKWIVQLAVAVFGLCILGSVALGFAGMISSDSTCMVPLSAAYCVPFLVFLWWWMRPLSGLLGLLWPALYGLHAILILAGAPILFTGPYQGLNMLVPTVGYGLFSALVGHAYNRFALRRLQQSARAGI
ncbi:MAG TPA: hypothetical protein VM008_06115 [Phycisphaerae bacterium]|nr:hypothetical protein [Phycisphaerae bacterium]